jgi:hypothetical protein
MKGTTDGRVNGWMDKRTMQVQGSHFCSSFFFFLLHPACASPWAATSLSSSPCCCAALAVPQHHRHSHCGHRFASRRCVRYRQPLFLGGCTCAPLWRSTLHRCTTSIHRKRLLVGVCHQPGCSWAPRLCGTPPQTLPRGRLPPVWHLSGLTH